MNEPVEPAAQPSVDIAQVERLVAAIENDLAKMRSGSENVAALRSEVDALKRLLDENAQPAPVQDRLRSLHGLLDELVDDAIQGARYVAEIGRMLGM